QYSCISFSDDNEAHSKNEMGMKYLNNGQLDLAIIEFRNAANATMDKKNKTTFLRNLAIAFHESGDLDSSKFYSLIAASLHDNQTYDYLINMADVNMIDGNINQAISKLKKAIEIGGVRIEPYN